MSAIDQKRIAKNTLLLYVRMGLIMIVSLYTSRVVLDALGEVDFGIYSAVGSIVVMFSFLSNTLSSVCQRFFSFELGRGNHEELHRIFCMSLLIFAVLAVIVFILLETVGMWMLNNKMNVADRHDAAVWVFHCVALGFIFQILRTPYMGMIITREKMKVFAYVSVIEAVATLAVALALQHAMVDKLKFYALLIFGIQVLVMVIYYAYCRICYVECRYQYYFERKRFTELISFTGWETIGGMAIVARNYGINVLINMFFGPVLNTPRQIAQKVYMSILQLQTNFYMAFKPQIVKSYASQAIDEMQDLLCKSIRVSYYLLFAVGLPILLETQFVLDIWLKDVPNYTVLFTQLMIINGLFDISMTPLGAAIQASGKIKWYSIFYGTIMLMILPISYIGLKVLRWSVISVFYIPIAVSFFAQLSRLYFAKHCAQVSLRQVWHSVVRIVIVTLFAVTFPILLSHLMTDSPSKSVTVLSVSFIWTLVCIYLFGITKNEKKQIKSVVSKLIGETIKVKSYDKR
ncbi:MAG: lipopolysaccharide biosynthesis protein [Salinivirgaceae bacterium]|nr:lipopolysaccharide biosynthesis protein [Salinivirgaceae bacterium]